MKLIKKSIVLLLLSISLHSLAMECPAYFALRMQAICPKEHQQGQWHKYLAFISSLAQYCEETKEDTSAQAFSLCQQKAITTIKNIHDANKSDPHTIIVWQSARQPLIMPASGLAIMFDYDIKAVTTVENKSIIHNAITHIQDSLPIQDKKIILNNLENLELIFRLMSGQARLRISNE